METFIKLIFISLFALLLNISTSQAEEKQEPAYVTACEEQYAYVSVFPPRMMDDLIKNTRDNYRKQKEAQARRGVGGEYLRKRA